MLKNYGQKEKKGTTFCCKHIDKHMDRLRLTERPATFFERDDIKTLIWPTTRMAVELHKEMF